MAGASSRPYRPPKSRLKAVNLDPLETVGLPSKGDDRSVPTCWEISTSSNLCRLLDFKVQEEYYDKIVDQYNHLDIDGSIHEAFGTLSLDANSEDFPLATKNTILKRDPQKELHIPGRDSKELAVILMAMRKLREAIVASVRKDEFALRAYIFMIRATILEKHMESYQPALLHLLHGIHPEYPLTAIEYPEFVDYLVLDLACRQKNIAAAFQAKYHHGGNPKIEAVLKALVRGDWCSFWKIERSADRYQKQLLSWGEEEMRRHAIKCVGKSYLSLDKIGLERALKIRWEDFEREGIVDWQLEGGIVTTRKIKGR